MREAFRRRTSDVAGSSSDEHLQDAFLLLAVSGGITLSGIILWG
jgi:hypothetical protein